MTFQVFISYSHADRFCARLLEEKLRNAGIDVWRDVNSLAPGREWRREIEIGLDKSRVVVVLMSVASCNSSYVTFEWAFALGRGKTLLPIKLDDCTPHKRLDVIQYSLLVEPSDEAFDAIIQRLKTIAEQDEVPVAQESINDRNNLEMELSVREQNLQSGILAYLNSRGFQAVSFQRVQEKVDNTATDAELKEILRKSPYFEPVTLRDRKAGLRFVG